MGKKLIIVIILILGFGIWYFYPSSSDANCANEGEQFSVVYGEYSDNCCGDLTEWESGFDTRISVEDKCYEMGLLAGNPVGTCINCGNGICEDIEDVCNCPQDCPNGENSEYATSESFCEWLNSSHNLDGCGSTNLADFNYELCNLCK